MKAALFAFIAGLFIGAAVLSSWQHRSLITEAPAPASRQSDGSLVLERKADSKAKTAAVIPKGAELERIVHGVIKPTAPECPLCKFDLALVRMPDHSRRVILRSDTGTVIDGLDVPTIPIEIPTEKLWAAGVSYGESWGAWVDRDIGPIRVGAEANNIGDKFEARLKLGLRF